MSANREMLPHERPTADAHQPLRVLARDTRQYIALLAFGVQARILHVVQQQPGYTQARQARARHHAAHGVAITPSTNPAVRMRNLNVYHRRQRLGTQLAWTGVEMSGTLGNDDSLGHSMMTSEGVAECEWLTGKPVRQTVYGILGDNVYQSPEEYTGDYTRMCFGGLASGLLIARLAEGMEGAASAPPFAWPSGGQERMANLFVRWQRLGDPYAMGPLTQRLVELGTFNPGALPGALPPGL